MQTCNAVFGHSKLIFHLNIKPNKNGNKIQNRMKYLQNKKCIIKGYENFHGAKHSNHKRKYAKLKIYFYVPNFLLFSL